MTELGQKLKEVRTEKNISLDDLQEITKIQKRYLVAIEEGNYHIIPGKFYVRAFIKQYAEAIGLQPELIFDEFKNDIPPAYEDDLPEQLSRTQSRKMAKGPSKFMEVLPKIILTLFIVGALILAWYFIQLNWGNKSSVGKEDEGMETPVELEESGTPTGKSSEETEEPAQEEEAIDEEPPLLPELLFVETNRGESIYDLVNASEFQVRVASTPGGETWVNVVNGSNEELLSETIKDGKTHEFDLTDQESVWIRAGNLSYTEIFVNDIKLDIPDELIEARRPHNFVIRFVSDEVETGD